LGAYPLPEFSPGDRFSFALDAGSYLLQTIVSLDLAHDLVVALIVVAHVDGFAIKPDSVGHNMDVFVLGVGVPGDNILVVAQAHLHHIRLSYLSPLLVTKLFSRHGRQGNVDHRVLVARSKLSDSAEFTGQFSRGVANHVFADHGPFAQVISDGSTKSFAFDDFADHGGAGWS
jgi:hypothetical protein